METVAPRIAVQFVSCGFAAGLEALTANWSALGRVSPRAFMIDPLDIAAAGCRRHVLGFSLGWLRKE
jgi:hypothetical protein